MGDSVANNPFPTVSDWRLEEGLVRERGEGAHSGLVLRHPVILVADQGHQCIVQTDDFSGAGWTTFTYPVVKHQGEM